MKRGAATGTAGTRQPRRVVEGALCLERREWGAADDTPRPGQPLILALVSGFFLAVDYSRQDSCED